jgi:hypothetical protein
MPADGGGVVRITLDDIYRQLVGLSARVDTALSKHERVEQLVAEHDAELRPLTGAADRLRDHEERIRAIERQRWPLASVSILVPLAALAVAILVALYGGPSGK